VAALAFQLASSSAESQSCSNSLASVNACAAFVLPGAGEPSADCCAALQGVDHECICSTLRIASQIPSLCNLPAITCGI
ncbi:hypothetical protein M569_14064, partial [Genlisea aurea]